MEKINTSLIDEELKNKLNTLIEENEKLINEKEKKEAEIKKDIQRTERNHDNTTSDIMKQQANIQKKKLQTELGDIQREFDERINENKEKIKNLIEQAKEQIQKEKNDAEEKMITLNNNIKRWANDDKTKRRLAFKRSMANLIVSNTKILQNITDSEERDTLEEQIAVLKDEMHYGSYTRADVDSQLNILKQSAKERNACYEKLNGCLDELDKLDEMKEEIGIEDKDFYQQNKQMFEEKVTNKLWKYMNEPASKQETTAVSEKREDLENKIYRLEKEIENNPNTDYTDEIERIEGELKKFFVSVEPIRKSIQKKEEALNKYEKLCEKTKIRFDKAGYEKERNVFSTEFAGKLEEWKKTGLENIALDEIEAKHSELEKRLEIYDKNWEEYEKLATTLKNKETEIETKYGEEARVAFVQEIQKEVDLITDKLGDFGRTEIDVEPLINRINNFSYKSNSLSDDELNKQKEEALDKYAKLCGKTKQEFANAELYKKEIAVFRIDFEEPLNEWRQKTLEDISLDDIESKYDDLKVRLEVYDKNDDKLNQLGEVVEAKAKEIKKTYSQQSEREEEGQKFIDEFAARIEEIENILETFGREEIDDAKLNKLIEDIKSYNFEKEPPKKQQQPKRQPVISKNQDIIVTEIFVDVKNATYNFKTNQGEDIKIRIDSSIFKSEYRKQIIETNQKYGVNLSEKDISDHSKHPGRKALNSEIAAELENAKTAKMVDWVIATVLQNLDNGKDINQKAYIGALNNSISSEERISIVYDMTGVEKNERSHFTQIGKELEKHGNSSMIKDEKQKDKGKRKKDSGEDQDKENEVNFEALKEEIEKLPTEDEQVAKLYEYYKQPENREMVDKVVEELELSVAWMNYTPEREDKEEQKSTVFERIKAKLPKIRKDKTSDSEEKGVIGKAVDTVKGFWTRITNRGALRLAEAYEPDPDKTVDFYKIMNEIMPELEKINGLENQIEAITIYEMNGDINAAEAEQLIGKCIEWSGQMQQTSEPPNMWKELEKALGSNAVLAEYNKKIEELSNITDISEDQHLKIIDLFYKDVEKRIMSQIETCKRVPGDYSQNIEEICRDIRFCFAKAKKEVLGKDELQQPVKQEQGEELGQ